MSRSTCSCIGVSVMPGETALTRMPRFARATANVRVVAWIAVLVAE
jgi:hypothetical protein